MEVETTPRAAAPLESTKVRRIVPTKRRIRPGDIFREPSVVQVLALRDFKAKYKQALLGPLWLVFQPLALLAAFFVAFRSLANVQPGIPYMTFALAGLMVWSFFQAAMTIGSASLISSFHLIRFTPCMRQAFPVASAIASLPSLAVTVLGALIAAAVTGTISPRAVLLPIGFLWLFLLTIGTILIAAALAVRFRDIISVIPFVLQLGLFLAPVGYPLSSLSEPAQTLVELNPLTGLIEGFRWTLLSGYNPTFWPIGLSIVTTTLIVFSGWLIFSRLETTMADEI